MFKRLLTTPRVWPTRVLLTVGLTTCLLLLALSHFRSPRPDASSLAGATYTAEVSGALPVAEGRQTGAPRQLQGEQARVYLEKTEEGQSLMAAVTQANFGLNWQERAPFGSESKSGGYLGMSDDQNLNAWFDEEGATIRPSVPEKKRATAWQLGLRLKAYGYQGQMQAAPAITSRNVKGTRIEYVRQSSGGSPAGAVLAQLENPLGAGVAPGLSTFSSVASAQDNARVVEWYENRAEGIEQGFTIDARPERSGEVAANEPLRVSLGVEGDLRARAVNEGQQIELVDKKGKGAVSYSKLTAQDADGKPLAAHMEASVDGREIALVVVDASARYPIAIDPVVATLEKKLDAGFALEADAQFGFAVAIDGDRAVVGAWRKDGRGGASPDAGFVQIFTRIFTQTGPTWSQTLIPFDGGSTGDATGWSCGYSVAIWGNRVVYGCPGAEGNTGRAGIMDLNTGRGEELIPPPGTRGAGDRYGASVAISGGNVIVGAPFARSGHNGSAHRFTVDSRFDIAWVGTIQGVNNNDQFGTSVSVGADGNTFIAGAPGVGAGRAYVFTSTFNTQAIFQPSDGAAGDLFGQSVAISGNTAVVGAPGNDEKGESAGAAYVFVRDASRDWSQQQKLTASDPRAFDFFGAAHIAIEGNTIIVGAYGWDSTDNINDEHGKVYIFMRRGTAWTQQGIIRGDNHQGDQFGIGVGLSGDTVIVGARGATAQGTAIAGAAYVYRLDCVPPYFGEAASAVSSQGAQSFVIAETVCPGVGVDFRAFFVGTATSYQWRKNGINITGATSRLYTIPNVSASDAGSYDVIISNSCGDEISSPATLNIHTFSLSQTSGNFGASGSDGLVGVSSTGSCPYTAVPNASWIKITSNGSSTAPKNVGFHIDPNTGPNQRTGSISIGDKTFTVTQDGLNCSYSIAPTSQSFTASGGANSVSVTATAGCAWTAQSNDSWITTVPAGAGGTGSGTLNYTVAANTGPSRTGTLTVAGQTFTITQASGCTYSISPTSQNFPASVAAGAVNATTVAGCAWAAASNASFITITSGASGTGNGTVNYTVSANTSTSSRSGTITIAGQTFTVTQTGAVPSAPTLQFSQSSYTVAENFNPTNGINNLPVTVTRSGDLSQAATVNYASSDTAGLSNCNPNEGAIAGVASSRCDYAVAVGTLRFAAGESSKAFSLIIIDDAYVEGAESLTLTLSNPTGASLGAQGTATVTITDNDLSNSAPNPADQASFFVRQHYVDFLGREPDPFGFQGWQDILNNCSGGNKSCDRIEVSSGFFRSTEFQERGYFIYRFYSVALGRKPDYAEF
ncbi:MAG: BACON domain-containing carbohydrate-binding protein, partial [Acidobacteriota bacterium]